MKRSTALAASAVALGVISFVLWAPASDRAPVAIGAEAPDLRVSTLSTPLEERSIEDYRGQVVLLNVWATWCPPCREEMPSLQALHEQLHEKGLRVVAVSIDDPGSEDLIREFVQEQALTFEILHDPAAAVMDAYQVRGVPETFVIDRDGRIRYRTYFTDWRSEENRRRVENLLAEDS